jgi:hypothetical protein
MYVSLRLELIRRAQDFCQISAAVGLRLGGRMTLGRRALLQSRRSDRGALPRIGFLLVWRCQAAGAEPEVTWLVIRHPLRSDQFGGHLVDNKTLDLYRKRPGARSLSSEMAWPPGRFR